MTLHQTPQLTEQFLRQVVFPVGLLSNLSNWWLKVMYMLPLFDVYIYAHKLAARLTLGQRIIMCLLTYLLTYLLT